MSPIHFRSTVVRSQQLPGRPLSLCLGIWPLDVITGLSPSGLEIIDLRSAGTLINEVSVPVPALTSTARFYVSTSIASATAVTIVNPNDYETSIGFYFTATAGGTSNFGSFTLGPHQQTSGFLYTAPFFLPIDLKGTLTMSVGHSMCPPSRCW